MEKRSGLFEFWLRFGSVTGFFKPAPSPKPCQKLKNPRSKWLQYFFKRSRPIFITASLFWRLCFIALQFPGGNDDLLLQFGQLSRLAGAAALTPAAAALAGLVRAENFIKRPHFRKKHIA